MASHPGTLAPKRLRPADGSPERGPFGGPPQETSGEPRVWEGSADARFVFIGEKRSWRAIQLGVSWLDGRFAAETLHDEPRTIGLDPTRQRLRNLLFDGPGWILDAAVLEEARVLAPVGPEVVGLGRRVQAAFGRAGIRHLPLIHPAARGTIRRPAAYQAHVATVLERVSQTA